MAYFKLSLLTSQFENSKQIILQDTISEFNTQENVYNSKKQENLLNNHLVSEFPLNSSFKNNAIDAINLTNNNAVFAKEGKVTNSCLKLNSTATNYVTLPSLIGKKVFSIAFWFKGDPDSLTTQWSDLFTFITTNDSDTTECRVEITAIVQGSGNIAFFNNGHWSNNGGLGGMSFDTGWHHYCWVFTETQVFKYKNGEEIGTPVNKTNPNTVSLTGQFRIGDTAASRGYLNDIRIYDAALSQEEVKKIVNISNLNSLKDRKYSYCYSYNEKLSLTQNAQKTLTFNLDKYIIKENLREENPFARNIIIGSQILLVDQYNNNYFFTVKNIDYDIKETNITYKISCQDTFSYQATRQNAGYTINNSPEEVDFIGAKTIDWWVTNKIVPECHLSYTYLYMNEGLYESIDGTYKIFTYGDTLTDVNRIIKDAYSPDLDKDKDYYQTIPFSCSGSNANAALIALGDTLDLQLKTFEHISGLQYFWFEPKKNTNRVGGLIYSPYNSIQSFSLGHKGDSLTTIMNVEGPTYDDELITLIPSITPFFSNFVNNDEVWRKTYKNGVFMKQCQAQHYIWNDKGENTQLAGDNFLYYTRVWFENEYQTVTLESIPDFTNSLTYDASTGFFYIKLAKNPITESSLITPFELNPLFTFVSFNEGGISYFTGYAGTDNIIANSNTHLWSIAVTDTVDNVITEVASFSDKQDCKDFIGTSSTKNIWIKIFIGSGLQDRNLTISNFNPNLAFYREVSQEDIEFAQAADECPWLENKLIDFNYFLENKMISSDEYRNLMNFLSNDLRIINGQLMLQAKAYYQALHKRTQLIADLTNKLDLLGAAANADIVTNIRINGEITESSDTSSFYNAYRDTLITTVADDKKEKLLNYDEILSDYFNKFFSADQRFLKNIKNFKDYFNSKPSTWLDPATAFYDYKIELNGTNINQGGYVIADWNPNRTIKDDYTNNQLFVNLQPIPNDFSAYVTTGERIGTTPYAIYEVEIESNSITRVKQQYQLVTAENFNNYYIKNGDGTGEERVKDTTEKYNSAWAYYYRNNGTDTLKTAQEVKTAILQKASNGIYYRDTSEQYASVSDMTNAIPDVQNIFEDWTEDDYKLGFPVTEIYNPNNHEEKILFINEDTDDQFYKLNIRKKWKKNPNKIRFDVYGTKKTGDRNFIYGSTVVNDGPYKSSEGIKPTMGANYLFAEANGWHFKQNSYFKTLVTTQKINKNGIYKAFLLSDGCNKDNAITFFNNATAPKSTIAYWPIYNDFCDCDLIGSQIKNVDTSTLQQLLAANNFATPKDSSTYVWTPGSNCPFKDDFILVQITDYKLTECISSTTYEGTKIYCDQYDRPINFNDYTFPYSFDPASTSTYYYHKVKSHIHPSESATTTDQTYSLDGEYYKENTDGNFERVYTIKELKTLSNSPYRILNPSALHFDFLTPYETKITVPLQKITFKYSNGQIVDFEKTNIEDYTLYFTTDEIHSTPSQYYKVSDNTPCEITELTGNNHNKVYQTLSYTTKNKETLSFTLTKEWVSAINASTNGQLWYQCTHGSLANTPFAVNIAAAIEAQLEEYWKQAYTASLYCRYFLPESWQLTYDENQNFFSKDIIGFLNSDNVYLKEDYVPNVSVYEVNGKTVLPKYYISRGFKETYQTDTKSIDAKNRIDSSIFAANPVIAEAITYFGEQVTDFSATESGTTVYYYIADKDKDSGCTWSKLMLTKIGLTYNQYSGHYDLAYKLIKKNYLPLVLYRYEELLHDKQVLWDTLYQTYGFLMLENTYKNDTATTSPELMTLAKYAFKDYSAPERQYNITVIDSTSLKGYKGEEIRVGDGIQVDAQAYYNEYDQIFKSLSQYLFITDISYTLRSPTDISLTVNAIKYQDKLIQRLVKLIK